MEQDRDYSSVTPFWARHSPTAQRTLGNALKRVWTLLIFRDHWQGEFCVAFFGSVGWSIAGISSESGLDFSQYRLMLDILPGWLWKGGFLLFGLLQLYGLIRDHNYCRVAGAVGVFTGFLCIVLSLVFGAGPVLPSVATYLTCAAIEFCAVVLQTAVIIRDRGARWTTKQ